MVRQYIWRIYGVVLMTSYVTRIELNGPPDWSVYTSLHNELSRAGLSRFIRGSDGKQYKLPDGLYVGDLNTESVSVARDYIQRVVNSVHNSAEIIAFKYDGSAWVGLTVIA